MWLWVCFAMPVDAMAMIRTLRQADIPKTFGQLAHVILERICHQFQYFSKIDFVVYTYRSTSIKSVERDRRTSALGELRQHIASEAQQCPRQFSKYLSNGSNKEEFIAFLFDKWQHPDCRSHIGEGRCLYVTGGEKCVHLTSESADDCPRLMSNHEEADARLLLHANDAASNGFSAVTVKSPDTDVAILMCAFSHHIPSTLLLLTGTGNRRRVINMSAAGEVLGGAVCEALIGMHAFTGCDTTSCFAHRGKRSALDLLKKSPAACEAMSAVGQSFEPLSPSTLKKIEKFTCQLYRTSCEDVNEARYCTMMLRP